MILSRADQAAQRVVVDRGDSAKLLGLEKGSKFYTPYNYNDPTRIVARQEYYTTWKGENGGHDCMFFKDVEVGLAFYVDLDADGENTKIYDACAGFVFDLAPDLSKRFSV